MEQGYKFLEDEATADVAFEAYGKDLNELFENSCLAVTEIMVDLNDVNPIIRKELKKDNESIEDLLYDLLSEVVTLKDSESLLFRQFIIRINKEGNKYVMNAAFYGEQISNEMNLKIDIKAITLHEFNIKKEEKLWKAHVIVDI